MLKSSTINKHALRPYQTMAVNKVFRHLRSHDRATLVMACGTGKTLTATRLVNMMEPAYALFLFPSLALLSQTRAYWLQHNLWGDNVDSMAICSDPSIGESWCNPNDCEFVITTEEAPIRKFLSKPSIRPKVIFSTYHSSGVLSQAIPESFEFDIAIFDEAHKTASSKDCT